MRRVVIDTGPLVALLDADERHHGWVVAQLERMEAPLITCEAVLAEACHLLRGMPEALRGIEGFCRSEALDVRFRFTEHHERVLALMRKYQDRPMSFADACLVCLVEQIEGASVFTLDGDFRIYRQKRRRIIPVVMPD